MQDDESSAVAPDLPDTAASFDQAMERLATDFPGTFQLAFLARTLHADEPDGIAPTLAELMKSGQLVEAGALITTVLELMRGRPRVQWLRPKTALRCVMKLYERGAREVHTRESADEAMEALYAWRNGWLTPPDLDDDTRRWWAWLDELRKVGDSVPEPMRTELLIAAGAADLSQARPAVSELTAADPELASTVHARLIEGAPLVEEAIGFLLIPAAKRVGEVVTSDAITVPRDAQASFARPGPGTVDLLRDNADAVVGAVSRQLGPKVTLRRVGVVLGLLASAGIAYWTLTQAQADAEADAIPPELEDVYYAGQDLCDYLGPETSGCVFAKQVVKGVEREDCSTLRTAMRNVERTVRGTPGFDEFSEVGSVIIARDALELLVGRFKDLCVDDTE